MNILALDIATVTGWAYGTPGSVPRLGTQRWAPPSSSNADVGCGVLRWASDFLKMNPVDVLYFEAPFDPRVMGKRTNFNTTRILVGLPFLIETLFAARNIATIREVPVAAVRKHFLGKNPRGEEGKKEVQRRCRQLGWRFDSDDAADAGAVWAYACAIEAPKAAIATAPLFGSLPADAPHPQLSGRQLAAAVWAEQAFDNIEDIPS